MTTYPLIEIDAIPRTLEEFLTMRGKLAATPEGGAVVALVALLLYAQAPDSELAMQALTIAVDQSRLRETADGYRGWAILAIDLQRVQRQLRDRPWTPQSYILETDPKQGYQLPQPPYQFEVSDNVHSGNPDEGIYKVFVRSSGAASPRPVTMKRNNRGIWKALEWSSLLMGIIAPAKPRDDDL
ncbi:MAG: hypothetical protein P1S60_08865 [Anaerolineae bacterium]|nr:hypothetical protein [Anaerolineae bacterium]